MKKKSFKEILKEVPKPKSFDLYTELPKYFDTQWDIKEVRHIFIFGQQHNEEIKRALAEHGYDVSCLGLCLVQYRKEKALDEYQNYLDRLGDY